MGLNVRAKWKEEEQEEDDKGVAEKGVEAVFDGSSYCIVTQWIMFCPYPPFTSCQKLGRHSHT